MKTGTNLLSKVLGLISAGLTPPLVTKFGQGHLPCSRDWEFLIFASTPSVSLGEDSLHLFRKILGKDSARRSWQMVLVKFFRDFPGFLTKLLGVLPWASEETVHSVKSLLL